jgi:hypothetical protein
MMVVEMDLPVLPVLPVLPDQDFLLSNLLSSVPPIS